jgi:hypothetical protein
MLVQLALLVALAQQAMLAQQVLLELLAQQVQLFTLLLVLQFPLVLLGVHHLASH